MCVCVCVVWCGGGVLLAPLSSGRNGKSRGRHVRDGWRTQACQGEDEADVCSCGSFKACFEVRGEQSAFCFLPSSGPGAKFSLDMCFSTVGEAIWSYVFIYIYIYNVPV